MFYKEGIFKNILKFTGKHLRHSFFLNKVEVCRPVTFRKRDPGTAVSKEFCKFLKERLFFVTLWTATSEIWSKCLYEFEANLKRIWCEFETNLKRLWNKYDGNLKVIWMELKVSKPIAASF